MDDARTLAEKLKIRCLQNDLIPGIFESFLQDMMHILPTPQTVDESNIRHGNVYARLRMIVLRDIAKANNALVLGTGNASERLLGYATIAGDGLGGVDNLGLYHVFKTEVFTLAKALEMQKSIIEKVPSAGLWSGQTDEMELGASYAMLDQILTGYCLGYEETELTTILKAHGIPESVTVNTLTRVRQNSFKNSLPIHP
jgi:NAD+ synthase